jgi:2-C-methyl-D-erythritol 4-phosphate cytidylyltransferase
MRVFVILPAAGMGTRMAPGHATPNAPKQFLALQGLPILVHSLRAFAAVPRVSCIYVAVRKPEMGRMESMIAEHSLASRVRVVEGGDTRQASVSQALKALSAADDDIILVHDAVRPLIDPATIERTIEAVGHRRAAGRGYYQTGRAHRPGSHCYRYHSPGIHRPGADPTRFSLERSASSFCRRGGGWICWNR